MISRLLAATVLHDAGLVRPDNANQTPMSEYGQPCTPLIQQARPLRSKVCVKSVYFMIDRRI